MKPRALAPYARTFTSTLLALALVLGANPIVTIAEEAEGSADVQEEIASAATVDVATEADNLVEEPNSLNESIDMSDATLAEETDAQGEFLELEPAAVTSWDVTVEAVRNTTTAVISIDKALVSDRSFSSVTFTARMSYKGSVTREVIRTYAASDFDDAGSITMDFENYGKFSLVAEFKKDNTSVKTTDAQTVGIVADAYNISPVSATLPVTFFSLNLWGEGNIRESGPVILLMERPAAYDWNALPEGVYGLPFLSLDELSYQPGDFTAASDNFKAHEQVMADYVHDLMEVSPDAHFNVYCVDIYVDLVQRIVYANQMDSGQYSVRLLSDGSYTPTKFASVYAGEDPQAIHEKLTSEWNSLKSYAYEHGKVADSVTPGSCGKYYWACIDSENDVELWVARKDLMKSPDDGNVFGSDVQANPKLVQVNIGNLLKQNIQGNAANEAEFKALYNFNDSFFSASKEQGKDAMVFLGTRVTGEQTFVNYARFVMSYYGDDFVYYYKGHPATPTDLYPEKIEQLESLCITDVDASIAAELILFFNPEIYLSGYTSSTYASVPEGMGKGMFNMTREAGLSDPQYEHMDFWMTMVRDDTDKRAKSLCISGHESYLVEFSDAIAKSKGYEPVGKTGTRYIAIWDATTSDIVYYCLNDDETSYEQVGSEQGIGAKTTVDEGTYIIQSALANGMVLDVAGGSKRSGANVQLYQYNKSAAQKWKITVDSDGFATVTNVGSGLVLDVSGGRTANKTNVQQYKANGSKAQKWVISKGNSGHVTITSALNPTISLDVAGAKKTNKTNVQIYADNGSKAQQFLLLATEPSITPDGQAEIEDGYYTISTALNTDLVLDLQRLSKANGVSAQIRTGRRSAYQLFKITKLKDGFYQIKSAYSETVLDLDGGKIIPGANVQLWKETANNKNQEWAIYEHTGGSFTIQNVASGLMLDVSGGKKVAGTNVDGYVANGTQAQRWLLHTAKAPTESLADMAHEYAGTLSDGTYVINSALGNKLVLDVKSGSLANKGNVQTWTSNGTGAQQWIVSHDENGFVTFTNKKSGKVLDIAGGRSASGANIWQYAGNGTKAQKWIVVPSVAGGYELVSAYSPYLVLDVTGASTRRGANVHLYTGNGTTAQRFTFTKISK